MKIGELIEKDFEDNGQSTRVNINYLIGVLKGLLAEEERQVKLSIVNDKPLLINDIFLIADIRNID